MSMQLSGLRDVFEGKSALEFRMFKKMCYVLMTLIAASSLFMSPYLILAWNLLSRSNNIKSIHCKHFDWSEDALMMGSSSGLGLALLCLFVGRMFCI